MNIYPDGELKYRQGTRESASRWAVERGVIVVLDPLFLDEVLAVVSIN